MPSQNYATLKYLFRHFKMIEKYQNENLMNSGKHLNNEKFNFKAFLLILTNFGVVYNFLTKFYLIIFFLGNLAICLGLCLFSNSFGEVPNPFDNDISKCNMLCKYLIDNYYDVFESFEEAR